MDYIQMLLKLTILIIKLTTYTYKVIHFDAIQILRADPYYLRDKAITVTLYSTELP